MKLTVDASVVVKWYVSEAHSEVARTLLGHRLERFAPDFVLVELANIFWKKARLGEIGDSQAYFQELSRVRQAVVLSSSADLIGRAADVAAQIDHPVYDCLYIACAEATGSTLITADRRLIEAVSAGGLDVDIQYIGAHGVADSIRAAATALVITQDKLAELVAASDRHLETAENVFVSVTEGRTPSQAFGHEDSTRILDSPAVRRLTGLLVDLNDEERIDLLALGLLGQGNLGSEWQSIFERACTLIDVLDEPTHGIIFGVSMFWRDGFERLTGVSI